MSDRTALVVGGTSGIGLATARQLLNRGADVHVTGRGQARLDELTASDPGLHGHRADGGDGDQMAALVESIGQLDWLVIALSGAQGAGPIGELDLGVLRNAFDAKFWAHLTTLQAALPRLAPTGSITFISAASARASLPGTAGLAAINGALEAIVKPLAVELAPIRVNAVSPGITDTPWWSGLPADDRAAYFVQAAQSLPARRVPTADEVAEAVVLAATNPNITGTVLETDGGARLVQMG
ncbi:MAG TPA: SDR family oxidoreductase [Pseudonocardiaceae bacterium]|nr:SDR family oxidoreductase [Pseudonocardiaceae bacterium]